MRVLVVIPAFNEEVALARLLVELADAKATSTHELELLVVDDGSRDATRLVAREGGARVLRLCANLGIGGAVQSGLHVAHREGFDCAVQLDGDGQHPPSELPGLLAAMQVDGAPDLLLGSRFHDSSRGDNFRSTMLRRLGIGWLRLVLRVVTGAKITDPTSGYRVYGRRALALFDETYPYDFPEPESVAVARAVGLETREVGVKMRERQGGRSSIGALDAVYYMVKVTVAVLLAYVRNLKRAVVSELNQYWIFAAVCLAVVIVLLRLVLRERLMLQGSLSYIGFLAVLGCMALFPSLTARLAHAMGFTLLSNFFFAVAIALLSLLHLRALVTISKVHQRTVTLTQELAIAQEKQGRAEEKRP